MKQEKYYFIVVDKDGKRHGKEYICDCLTAEKTAISLTKKYVFCYYYNGKEWENESAMFWYFRNILEYNGLFNDKI